MEVVRKLQNAAQGMGSLYKILIGALLIYELVKFRMSRRKSGVTGSTTIDNARRTSGNI